MNGMMNGAIHSLSDGSMSAAGWAGLLLGAAALLYLTGALVSTFIWTRKKPAHEPDSESIKPFSILKPLAGLEPELYENLRSFCTQDYPEYQVIFGAQAANDPALELARRLQNEFPQLDIKVVSGDHINCINRKIANLAHMAKFASHEYLVASDSSTRVASHYLKELAAHLADPGVGVVTCLYWGRPTGDFFSRLGALYMNEWFTPSILFGWLLGLRDFGFGSTLALRRSALDAIGGFAALKDQLADDYMLAQLLREQGLRTVLSRYLVQTTVHETSYSSLWQHELRWVRAVCILQPIGHALSLITHTVPMTLLASLLAWNQSWNWMMPCAAVALRLMMHMVASRTSGLRCTPFMLLLPLREATSFAVWLGSYFGRHVHWRGRTFAVHANGNMEEVG